MRGLIAIYACSSAVEHGAIALLQGVAVLRSEGAEQVVALTAISAVALLSRLAGHPLGGRLADGLPLGRALGLLAAAGAGAAALLACGLAWGPLAALAGLAVVAWRAGVQDPVRLAAVAAAPRPRGAAAAHAAVQSARILAIAGALVLGGCAADAIWGAGAPLAAGWPAAAALGLLAVGEWIAARRLPPVGAPAAPAAAAAGWRSALRFPGALPAAVLLAAYWASNQVLVVCFPDHLRAQLGISGATAVLAVHAVALIGTLAGLAAAVRWPALVASPARPAALAFAALALLPWPRGWQLAVPLVLIYGAAGGALLVAGNLAMQRCAPPGGAGAAFAMMLLAQSAAMLAALAGCAALGAAGVPGAEVLAWASPLAAIVAVAVQAGALRIPHTRNACTNDHSTGSTSRSSPAR